MPIRLLKGLAKGLLLGALIGWGLAAAGFAVPGALVAYPAAALAGAIVALVAGKPIWAEGARIEVGLKAGVGALLAPALMFAVRRWLTMAVPFDVGFLPGVEVASGGLGLGTFAITSLAIIGAVLAGFYDADHKPTAAPEGTTGNVGAAGGNKRIAAASAAPDLADVDAGEHEAVDRKQRR